MARLLAAYPPLSRWSCRWPFEPAVEARGADGRRPTAVHVQTIATEPGMYANELAVVQWQCMWGRPIHCWIKTLPKEEGNTEEGKVKTKS